MVPLTVKSLTTGVPSALAALVNTLPVILVSSGVMTDSLSSVKSETGVTFMVKVDVSVFTPSETV